MQISTTVIDRGAAVPNVVLPQLSHGNNVAQVVTGDEKLLDTDGVWTKNSSLTLGVTTADCAPICFTDDECIGVAHVGWRGLATGMIDNMLGQFNGDCLQVHLGPHLHQFEVQRNYCYEALMKSCDSDFFTEQSGRTIFQFTQALLSKLPEQTQVDSRDTATDFMLPSYRHDRNNERILTTVRL